MRFRLLILGISALLSSCQLFPQERGPSRLFCAVLGYVGKYAGSTGAHNGILESRDGGFTWEPTGWGDIKGTHVASSPDGRFLYAAAGNGILVSRNGGTEWVLTGGWEITEVLGIAPHPREGRIAWAVSAYGLYRTEDAGETWIPLTRDGPFRYAKTVIVDMWDGDRLWVGSEKGLFTSPDGGRTFKRSGPGAPIRCLCQDKRTGTFWAGTDGEGLWISRDGGEEWNRVGGPGPVVHCILPHPDREGEFYTGQKSGVFVTRDEGVSWQFSREGIEAGHFCYTLLADRKNPLRLLAGTNQGLYESLDGGARWKLISLKGGLLSHLAYVDIPKGPGGTRSKEPGSLTLPAFEAGPEHRPDPEEDVGFQARAMQVRATILNREFSGEKRPGIFALTVLWREGRRDKAILDRIREIFEKPGHDMFWVVLAHQFYQNAKTDLPPDLAERIRKSLVENGIYRGDTENHFIMYYTGLLLSAESWPETSAATWYTGRTTAQNHAEAVGWLDFWTRTTATLGQGEFDTPAYFPEYMLSLLLLYDFAKDERIRFQAGMALDLLFADYAAEALGARYCGGHSRIYDPHVIRGDGLPMASYRFLFFGGVEPPKRFAGWSLPATYTKYRLPEVVLKMASDRDQPYVHRERKRVRNCLRYVEALNPPVYKVGYMTSRYCLGSLQGGILQPIQQHTWDVTWVGTGPHTTLFSVHPYFSKREIAMFFPEDVHFADALVYLAKKTYNSPDKWISASPYEKVFQVENALIAVYNIPAGTDFNQVSLFFPKCLERTEREGWIFGRDGGFFVAVFSLGKGAWEEAETHHRLRIPAGKAAFVVEAGSEEEDGSFEDFVESVVGNGKPKMVLEEGGPAVEHTTRRGKAMRFSWAGSRQFDGREVRPAEDALFQGPFTVSKTGSGSVILMHGDTRRTLDFNALRILQKKQAR
ncbi:MAG: WD40/YVTN/BNR-like repeat-containing protein [Planctomycetota bacterium]